MVHKRTRRAHVYDDVDPQAIEREFLHTHSIPTPVSHPSTEIDDVRAYAQRFGFLLHMQPTHLTSPTLLEYFALVREHLDTVWEGMETHTLAQVARGLMELVYTAKLYACALGLPWEQLWDALHHACMEKINGPAQLGYHVHPIAPEGWQPPAFTALLEAAGYTRDAWFDRHGQPRLERFATYEHPQVSTTSPK